MIYHTAYGMFALYLVMSSLLVNTNHCLGYQTASNTLYITNNLQCCDDDIANEYTKQVIGQPQAKTDVH